jgi:hypothetical protein
MNPLIPDPGGLIQLALALSALALVADLIRRRSDWRQLAMVKPVNDVFSRHKGSANGNSD